MIDGEKRIVTFMGEGGRRTATIIWRNIFDQFEVECVEGDEESFVTTTQFFTDESKAQEYAQLFVWRESHATI
jgi:hypothetical protein